MGDRVLRCTVEEQAMTVRRIAHSTTPVVAVAAAVAQRTIAVVAGTGSRQE